MLRAYAQLLRLPNVFTAWADVLMGWMVAGGLSYFLGMAANGTPRPMIPGTLAEVPRAFELLSIGALLACSACLYSAGMVWNDFFDVEQDRRERPWRPIPSGKVSRRAAAVLGTSLVFVGLALSVVGPTYTDKFRFLPALISAALVCSIFGYDGLAKQNWAGPFVMGLCRFWNVLLGMSVVTLPLDSELRHAASVVAIYIVGVTLFARKEAQTSRRVDLCAGAAVILGAVILAIFLPMYRWSIRISPGLEEDEWLRGILLATSWSVSGLPAESYAARLYIPLLLSWALIIGSPVYRAIRDPSPQRVQTAVKTCILGLIGLDALMAFCVVGWPGLLILLLLPPALILGKWVYST